MKNDDSNADSLLLADTYYESSTMPSPLPGLFYLIFITILWGMFVNFILYSFAQVTIASG